MQRFAADRPSSAAAFDELYDRYKDKTWRYFRRQLDNDAARDAQQELWMKIIERRTAYRAEHRFGGYLFSVANSVLMDSHRKNMRIIDSAIDRSVSIDEIGNAIGNATGDQTGNDIADERTAPGTSEPERATNLARAKTAIQQAISRLPLAQRNTFVLHQESGLSYSAIAQATDTTTETVKSRLRYARSKLAADLEGELRNVDL